MPDRHAGFAAPRRTRPAAARLVIAAHLAVVALAGLALVASHAPAAWIAGALASGTSLFALTGLVHEASHRHLARRRAVNDALGMLAGWPLLTPVSAYRAFHNAHHQATNDEGDPNEPLNSRWMLLVGAPIYVALIHRHALATLRGRDLARYLAETAAMVATLGLILALLPHAVRERAFLLPLAVVMAWQNLRIVAEHLDLPSGRFHDTWQLALPAPLSFWLLHSDHHLEHHLRPGLRWHELPLYRAEIDRGGFIPAPQRVTPRRFAAEVFCRPRPRARVRPDAAPKEANAVPAPKWAGRAAIRARPPRPNHPPRESVG